MLDYSPNLDRVFHVLADPTRRAMIERLDTGPATVSELAQPLAMSLAAVVQHLQVLEDSGLVRSQKTGRVRTCRLDRDGLGAAQRWIDQHSSEVRLERPAPYLAATPRPAPEPARKSAGRKRRQP
ncbi:MULTISPECIES: metalloregulator ArsR/SmtB family transcription factor [unclassified Lysobacter]|uniref:ArsR/SmtB family transcription factor n=2 Tax=Lysobacter TaxID=68 RepID=UPI0006F4C7DA|nr:MULTISPECIES: metalloregulator ArsR/SmtB family transcription factor [unclassified Lysobacter]KRA75913.1 hypothetical protein ASD78_08110 [Lysobacter sp. Root667]KRC36712.1 hypothetical protein ASE10_06275 [Lysobacter sp. Root76]KRD66808.1 hypothetical protein ASE45_15930 [Lysobacter sp. Root96]